MKHLYTQKLLLLEYEKRKNRNPQYSLRALARDIGLSRTTVIDVISGKRKLSPQNIDKLSARLKLEKAEISLLRSETQKTWSQLENERSRRILNEEDFEMLYSWYYYGILNLASVKNSKSSPKWIAAQLGITMEEAQKALRVLKKMKAVSTEGGKLFRLISPTRTTMDIPSRHIRELHRQFLYLAEDSLENVDISLRDIGSITIPIDPGKLPVAKQMLLDFRRKLTETLAPDRNSPTEVVYTLATQIFPTRAYTRSPS